MYRVCSDDIERAYRVGSDSIEGEFRAGSDELDWAYRDCSEVLDADELCVIANTVHRNVEVSSAVCGINVKYMSSFLEMYVST